jgi:hypothetical protein
MAESGGKTSFFVRLGHVVSATVIAPGAGTKALLCCAHTRAGRRSCWWRSYRCGIRRGDGEREFWRLLHSRSRRIHFAAKVLDPESYLTRIQHPDRRSVLGC